MAERLFRKLDLMLADMFCNFLFPSRNTRQETLIVSFCLGEIRGVEDRVAIYFKTFSAAVHPNWIRFKQIRTSRRVPASIYALRIVLLSLRYNLIFFLIDFNVASRVPSLRSLKIISKRIPVNFFWMETFDQENAVKRILPCLFAKSHHFVTDDPSLRLLNTSRFYGHKRQFDFFPAPFLPRDFFKLFSETPRGVDVSFYGAVDDSAGHKDRKNYLERISEEFAVNGFQSLQVNKNQRPSYAHMTNDLRNSKIGLNFSNHGGVGALTNRVTETIASGALLFSTTESVLGEFLTPGMHYVTFENQAELLSKLRYYLSNTNELQELSLAAQQFYIDQYTAEHLLAIILKMNSHQTDQP